MRLRLFFFACFALFAVAACSNGAPPASAPAADVQPANAAPAVDQAGHDTHDHAAHAHDEAHGGDDRVAHAGHVDGATECTCSVGKDGGSVWCDHCGSGYVAGAKVTDKAMVDAALAAAGHAARSNKVLEDGDDHVCTCPTGKAGGSVWCDHCGKGYIEGVASTDKVKVLAAVEAGK